MYQLLVSLTADRGNPKPKVLWEGRDWTTLKEKLNFWANEYRDSMDRICVRVVHDD